MASRPQVSALGRLSLSAKFVVGLVMLSIVAAVYFVVFFAEIDGQVSQAIAEEQNLRGELQKAEEARSLIRRTSRTRLGGSSSSASSGRSSPTSPRHPPSSRRFRTWRRRRV
jgi:type II secretory pathway pseudopilin PulG